MKVLLVIYAMAANGNHVNLPIQMPDLETCWKTVPQQYEELVKDPRSKELQQLGVGCVVITDGEPA